MTGNTVLLGIGLATGDLGAATRSATALGAFLLGAAAAVPVPDRVTRRAFLAVVAVKISALLGGLCGGSSASAPPRRQAPPIRAHRTGRCRHGRPERDGPLARRARLHHLHHRYVDGAQRRGRRTGYEEVLRDGSRGRTAPVACSPVAGRHRIPRHRGGGCAGLHHARCPRGHHPGGRPAPAAGRHGPAARLDRGPVPPARRRHRGPTSGPSGRRMRYDCDSSDGEFRGKGRALPNTQLAGRSGDERGAAVRSRSRRRCSSFRWR